MNFGLAIGINREVAAQGVFVERGGLHLNGLTALGAIRFCPRRHQLDGHTCHLHHRSAEASVDHGCMLRNAMLIEPSRQGECVALQHDVQIVGQRAIQQLVAHIAPHQIDLAFVVSAAQDLPQPCNRLFDHTPKIPRFGGIRFLKPDSRVHFRPSMHSIYWRSKR